MLRHQEFEATSRYLGVGRPLRSVDPENLKARWVVAIKRFWSTRSPESELDLDNVSAELRLRNIKPPLEMVREEFQGIQAEIERDYNSPRVMDHLTDKIEDFMKLLIERKH
jgi:hypothetical protein